MTDRQAAEAREWAQYLDNQGGIRDPTTARHLFGMADALDALSVRLAQAEQERDELLGWLRDEEDGYVRQRSLRKEAEVRLREYEEALKGVETALSYFASDITYDTIVSGVAQTGIAQHALESVRAALAASGGREAPDTKEPTDA